ncbi:NAD(P)-binding protein [Fomitopsis serialis]|uniref:NAD(P)-binding protein n=1 Tax=Fomitopsis serialis TaxID=139415 RepID=UPI002007A5F0|nr:NAD(P)-binding protein [Neoantrodia serialis]KAH9914737.1 NAD(P)-binding protein [Neoantrodia serialis]
MPSIVVAGASRGLGLEFVKQLLAEGNVVIALARNPAKSSGLVAIQDKNLHVFKADTTNSASLKAAAQATAEVTGGSLDILINNAAYQNDGHAFHTITEFESDAELVDDFTQNWHTNVIGPMLTINAFLPLLRRGALKKVFSLWSGLGDAAFNLASGFSGRTAYCVTKCALDMVNVKYALALKDEGFIFVAVSPGVVNTAEAPPPPEVMPLLLKQAQDFLSVSPHWKGPIEPHESVGAMLKVLHGLKPEHNGQTLSHWGNKEWL